MVHGQVCYSEKARKRRRSNLRDVVALVNYDVRSMHDDKNVT